MLKLSDSIARIGAGHRPARIALGLGLGMVLLLTGCGGAPTEPAPAASSAAPSSTATSAGSPTTQAASSAPTSPSSGTIATPLRQAMSEPQAPEQTNDDAGALAFAIYYQDTSDWAYATGDPSVLRTLCTTDNEQCARVISTVEMIGANDAIQYGGRSTLAVADGLIVANPEPDVRIVQTRLLIEPLELRSQSGELLDSRDAYDMTIAYKMRWVDDRWQIYEGVRVD